jgi:FPC/CPF motif-containing protein YcgG
MTKQTSFCQTLGNLQHGYALQELDQLLTEALQASQDTGKVSKVSVTLTIKPNGAGTYKITDDIKSTLPKFEKEATLLFTDGEQQLVREDPRQQKLKLEQVQSSGPIDLKGIPADSKPQIKPLN